jgi:rod shape-determining protein MreC
VGDNRRSSRMLVTVLVLSAVAVITVDARRADGPSPVDHLRSAVGAVMGPTEDAAATLSRPLVAIPVHFRRIDTLRRENARLATENAKLKWELRTSRLDRRRVSELDRIGAFGDTKGYRIASAQVIALGPAQSFNRTATIDIGRAEGVRDDLTVINGEGLVGRVIAVTRMTSTVLLAVDAGSTVGGRLGTSMELGFVRGRGMGGGPGLTYSMVDSAVSMRRGDTVFTWGSRGGAPYLPGIPVGQVSSVRRSTSDMSEIAAVRPFVDFSALDVVGVVVGDAGASAATATSGTQAAGGAGGGS